MLFIIMEEIEEKGKALYEKMGAPEKSIIQVTIRKSISNELGVFCLINKGIYHLNIFIELWLGEILIGIWRRKEYIKNEQKKRERYVKTKAS